MNLQELQTAAAQIVEMEMRATPGPWTEDSANDPTDVSVWAGGEVIANLGGSFVLAGVEIPIEAHNAKLIIEQRNHALPLSAAAQALGVAVEKIKEETCRDGSEASHGPYCSDYLACAKANDTLSAIAALLSAAGVQS